MTADELLHELESMTHAARMRRMVELGRRAAEDTGVAATLHALRQGGFYERLLALQSCYGSRDGAHALRALADPSRGIRALAIALVPLICDDAQAQSALAATPLDRRRALAKGFYKRRRRAVVDTFLETLAARGDEQLGTLLHFGSPDLVSRHLSQALSGMGDHQWRALARTHPALAAGALQRQAEAVERLDQRLVWQVNATLQELADAAPDRALALVGSLVRHVSLARLNLQRLAERRPTEVADLLLRSADTAHVSFDRVAHRLDTPRLLALVERHGNMVRERDRWFARLAPERRVALYHAFAPGWRDADGCLPDWLVALLPRDLREQEGRRHLLLPALAARPAQRLQYAAFLPWDEARAMLDPFLRNPDADLRVAAISALAYATRYHRDRLPDLLQIVRERRNEQDPVRQAMLAGLADLPPGMWRAEHLASLQQILREALDAADLSTATAGTAERLIVALLQFHPAWSAEWLATLVRERGHVSFFALEQRLSDDDVRRIAPALLPVLQSWEDRERERHILAAAWSLGRRLRVFDGLVDLLERLLRATRSSWIADQALALIAQHRRDRLAVLIPALLGTGSGLAAAVTTRIPALGGGDPSWITRPVVYTYLHRHRQDLLTPFLGQRAYRGRFSTGKTRFVLPLFDGFHRWTPAQQTIFSTTLTELAGDSVRDTPAVLSTIRQLAALPAVSPTRLIALASDPRLAVRDAALWALGGLDAGQGIPTLIEALNDDRARIAIYALRRALLAMPADEALPLLRAAPLEQVTVAKEVVRLLGDLRSEEAYAELLALDKRDLHRDVRVALLRALWSHLERDESWVILERAAAASDAVFARSVSRIPADRLSPTAQRRLAALIATLLSHPDPIVRVDVLRRCAQLPVADTGQVLLAPLLRAMGSALPDECAAAAGAIFQTYTGPDAQLVGQAVARLSANRRALWTAVQTLRQALMWSRGQLLPTARTVLRVLAADPLTASLQVELAAHALPWDELATLLTQLATSGQLHAEALSTATRAIEQAASRADAAELARLESALASSGDASLRRLALAALVALAQPPRGWDDERLARLRAYRLDPAPLVAAAAQFTFPPGEQD